MKFVIFHGAFGGPNENWFPDLQKSLELLGQEVIVPQFPVDTWNDITEAGPNNPSVRQTLDHWTEVFEKVNKELSPHESLCFVGHSLGPVFILHMVSQFNLTLDSAIFVCPFLTKLNRAWQIDTANASFYKSDFDFISLKKQIPVSYAIYSSDDPYVPVESARTFARNMGSSIIESKSGGHFNGEAHCTSLPLIVELCKVRIAPGAKKNYFSVV